MLFLASFHSERSKGKIFSKASVPEISQHIFYANKMAIN